MSEVFFEPNPLENEHTRKLLRACSPASKCASHKPPACLKTCFSPTPACSLGTPTGADLYCSLEEEQPCPHHTERAGTGVPPDSVTSFFCRRQTKGRGDGSPGKALALQAWGPEFDLQGQWHAFIIPALRWQGQRGSLKFTDQRTVESPGSARGVFSKQLGREQLVY